MSKDTNGRNVRSQALPARRESIRTACTIAIATLGLGGCAPQKSPNVTRAAAVLSKVGKFAEDSFYSCLLNAYAQGLSAAQAREDCSTRLLADNDNGFGGVLKIIDARFFDPSLITAVCSSVDPKRGQESGTHITPGWGTNTWGRNVTTQIGTVPIGLTQERSDRLKAEQVAAALDAWEKLKVADRKMWDAELALKAAKKGGDPQEIAKAQKVFDDASNAANAQWKETVKISEDASKDPNAGGTVRTTGEGGDCDQALQSARELLRECVRTQWKDYRCQQWLALMKGCADPALILIDPDQGYSCGAAIDREAVMKAWLAECEQRVKYGPDGSNPCKPPEIKGGGRFGRGKMGDICGSPYAQHDPDNNECSTVTIGKSFGQIDLQKMIVIFLNKAGGPFVVIPTNPSPPPRPGDPRPVPK